jgi:hypothetical protein
VDSVGNEVMEVFDWLTMTATTNEVSMPYNLPHAGKDNKQQTNRISSFRLLGYLLAFLAISWRVTVSWKSAYGHYSGSRVTATSSDVTSSFEP